MKKIYFFALLLLPVVITAQKSVDLTATALPCSIVRCQNCDSIALTEPIMWKWEYPADAIFLQDMSPEKTVLLEGWRKLPQDGHISISVKLGDLLPESVSVKERAND